MLTHLITFRRLPIQSVRLPLSQSHCRGFTLVEMLLVVALISLLISLLLPSLGRARYEATSAICGARKQQIGTGLSNYAMDHHRRYPNRWPDGGHHLPFWWSKSGSDMHQVADQYFGAGGSGLPPVSLLCAVAPEGTFGGKITWPLAGIYRTNISVFAGWNFKTVSASSSVPMLPVDQMPMRMGQVPHRPLAGPNIEEMTGDSVSGFTGFTTPHAYNRAYHNRSVNAPLAPPPEPQPYLLGDGSVIFTLKLQRVFRDPGWGMKWWAEP